MSQKESGWEKEFEKVMGCIPECANGLYEDVGCPAHGYDAMKAIKFFRSVLSNREKEIAEEVEKAYKEKSSQLHGGYDDADYLNAYGMAIHDVLQLLKH